MLLDLDKSAKVTSGEWTLVTKPVITQPRSGPRYALIENEVI
jgi:hypothetical protein